MLGRGLEFWQISQKLSGCLFELWGYAQGTRGRFLLEGKIYTRHSSLCLPPSKCHTWCADTEVHSFWCFLLADLSVGVQTAGRAPLCLVFLCRITQVTSGKESLADGWGRTRRRPRSTGRNILQRYSQVFQSINR